mgnify:CR=1 FL=1
MECMGRDRVRSIQLVRKAIESVDENSAGVISDLYSELAGYLAMGRTGAQWVWALGVLTNLSLIHI